MVPQSALDTLTPTCEQPEREAETDEHARRVRREIACLEEAVWQSELNQLKHQTKS